MKVYTALYNWMTYESSAETLSIHKTKEGAENAVAEHKANDRKEHEEQHTKEYSEEEIALKKKCGFTDKQIENDRILELKDYPKSWQWWGVGELELKD